MTEQEDQEAFRAHLIEEVGPDPFASNSFVITPEEWVDRMWEYEAMASLWEWREHWLDNEELMTKFSDLFHSVFELANETEVVS